MNETSRKSDKMQGEGDREAARHYDEATRRFVESGKVEEAAEQAGEQDPQEAVAAEQVGKEKAREKDPAVHRDYHKPVKD